MINVEHGEYRFFSGDNVAYRNSSTAWLFQEASLAEDQARRNYAAAGLMRALLDTPLERRHTALFFGSMDWVRDVILEVQADQVPKAPNQRVRRFVEALSPVNGIFDATSVAATKANKPEITAAIINKHIPKAAPKLVIGIGHSGILSSLKTFSALEGDNEFYAVRFSKNKGKDTKPALAGSEYDRLRQLAEGRAVVVHDEDRGMWGGETVRCTIDHLFRTLGLSSIGVTPVLARHPSSMWPEVTLMNPDRFGGFSYDTYESWSNKYKAIVDELKAHRAAAS